MTASLNCAVTVTRFVLAEAQARTGGVGTASGAFVTVTVATRLVRRMPGTLARARNR